MEHVTHEELMKWLDDELPPERAVALAGHMERCTECRRERAVFESLGDALRGAVVAPASGQVWTGVHKHISRPIGWSLFLAGLVVWVVYGVVTYALSPIALWEKLASGGIAIGLAMLLGSVLREHYLSWRTDPYRHVQR
ncbi:MAG TPA: zf-HC2 domain-containing protein [Longimicrobiales bacterium]|nr:zf-HC2 domain-containing protein [Longimicrobiales bacterium]